MSSLKLDVELTNHCNARCVFCPHPAMRRQIGYMSWETWQRVVEEARTGDVLRLAIAGFGEPTLHPNFVDFLQWARLQLPGTWLQLVTNGSQLWRMDFDALAGIQLTDIIVSFTGYSPESYESLMQGLSFEKLHQGLALHFERLQNAAPRSKFEASGCRLIPRLLARRLFLFFVLWVSSLAHTNSIRYITAGVSSILIVPRTVAPARSSPTRSP